MSHDPIDVHVGLRLKGRRRELRLSLEKLSEPLGVTWQQVAKYENGTNRLSASTMLRASRALGVPPGYFFTGMPDVPNNESTQDSARRQFANSPTGVELVSAAMACPEAIVVQVSRVLRTVMECAPGGEDYLSKPAKYRRMSTSTDWMSR